MLRGLRYLADFKPGWSSGEGHAYATSVIAYATAVVAHAASIVSHSTPVTADSSPAPRNALNR